MMFMEEDGGAGGGGSFAASMMPDPITQAEPVPDDEPEGEGGESAAAAAVKPASTVTLDPAAFAEAFKAAGLVQPPTAPAKPQPLTPEQLAQYKKQLGYWEFKPEFFQKFNNMETQAAAFQEYHEGVSQQFFNILEAFVGQRDEALRQQFQPVLQHQQQQQVEQQMSRFDTRHEQLKSPALRPLFNAAVEQLKQQIGAKQIAPFADETSMFDAIANAMAATLSAGVPGFKLNAPGSSPVSQPTGLKPAPQRGGGGGGSNNSGGGGTGVPLAVSMMPKIKV